MTKRTDLSRLLPSALALLFAYWLLPGCEGSVDSNRTGSESHFIRCESDADCTRGSCESGYCELNGRRLVQGEEPRDGGTSVGGNFSASGAAGAESSGGTGQGGSSSGGAGGMNVSGDVGAPAAGAGGHAGAGGGGAPSSSAVPLAFRIVNETSEVIHLDGSHTVRCGALGPQANCWYTTTDICMFDCSEVEVGAQCGVQCELPTPFVLRLQPGQEQVVPWDGRFIARNESHCSDADCYDASSIGNGSHVARVTAFTQAVCQFEPCVDIADGITQGYQTAGSFRHAEVAFVIPSPEDEIVLVVTDDSLSCPPAPEPCCGDGIVDASEACDDGNRLDDDECNAACGQDDGGSAGTGGTGGASGGGGLGSAGGTGGANSAGVPCGEITCGAGEYCRAGCNGTGGPIGPPSCVPLPVGCENDPSCDCVCNGFTSFCTPGAEAIQCGCP